MPLQAIERLQLLLRGASFCNNTRLTPPSAPGERWRIVGDPTEAALLVLAVKGRLDYRHALLQTPRIYELPFESERKRMTTILHENGRLVACAKGAPKEVLAICNRIVLGDQVRPLTDDLREAATSANDQSALDALRVLAVASRPLDEDIDYRSVEQVEGDLIFVGLVGMMDPPRPEVADAIKLCHLAGIKVYIDHGRLIDVARAI